MYAILQWQSSFLLVISYWFTHQNGSARQGNFYYLLFTDRDLEEATWGGYGNSRCLKSLWALNLWSLDPKWLLPKSYSDKGRVRTQTQVSSPFESRLLSTTGSLSYWLVIIITDFLWVVCLYFLSWCPDPSDGSLVRDLSPRLSNPPVLSSFASSYFF